MNMSEVNAREIRPDTWKIHVDDKHTDLIRIRNTVYLEILVGIIHLPILSINCEIKLGIETYA